MRRRFERVALAPDPEEARSRRSCEWPGCTGEGEFRAPLSRDQLDQYRWFCLDHVREYNRSWDYYRGMSQAEIEADLRRDTVWQRPTWAAPASGRPTGASMTASASSTRSRARRRARAPAPPPKRPMSGRWRCSDWSRR
jgi:hypothetical protein